MKCPKCGSTNLGGLMQAFWVALTEDGDMASDWNDHSGSTEIGDERICYDCDHEFSDGDSAQTAAPEKEDSK